MYIYITSIFSKLLGKLFIRIANYVRRQFKLSHLNNYAPLHLHSVLSTEVIMMNKKLFSLLSSQFSKEFSLP